MTTRGFYEFFAGGGMARAGLGEHWRCLFSNDFDPKKAACYAANWGNDDLFVGDVAGIAPFQLPYTADLAWASFPCQDLSLAGTGAGLRGSRSGTFWPFWRLIRRLGAEGRAPRTIVLENVCGLLTSNGGKDFTEVCRAVANDGYRLGAIVIDAALFVPQSRPRLFVIAIRNDTALDHVQLGTEPSAPWHTAALRAAYSALPLPLRTKWLWFDPALPAKRDIALIDIIERDAGEIAWHDEEVTQRLLSMMNPTNRRKVAAAQCANDRIVGTVYKRTRVDAGVKAQRAEVRFDGKAGCLRTPGGGSSLQTILMVEDGRVRSRRLTAREAARLMGLSERYRLPDNYIDAYHLTGDGVVTDVVRFIAETIIEPLLPATERTVGKVIDVAHG